jgi:hypothetical protein
MAIGTRERSQSDPPASPSGLALAHALALSPSTSISSFNPLARRSRGPSGEGEDCTDNNNPNDEDDDDDERGRSRSVPLSQLNLAANATLGSPRGRAVAALAEDTRRRSISNPFSALYVGGEEGAETVEGSNDGPRDSAYRIRKASSNPFASSFADVADEGEGDQDDDEDATVLKAVEALLYVC